MTTSEQLFRALANENRLLILNWLKRPTRHFPPQRDGDLVKDGVCGLLIARKLKVSHPTASEHLKILAQAGLLRGKKIKQWTFYKRNEAQIAALKRSIFDRI
ncbi:MAG TPA: ArsR family transcriptional regulator [Candidatus Acidoferrum sp.]|jgi:DNA-binding transcriptional ArsR family regulator|nr:ArsR family transcriptional regulator [Candidatus Acidoferrum sp.]